MDMIGTFEMALELSKLGMITAVHKHYSVEEWVKFATTNPGILDSIAVSAGVSDDDFEKLKSIMSQIPGLKMICLGMNYRISLLTWV